MFFLYHKKSFKTGKVLGRCLGVRFGREHKATDDLVRWGNAVPLAKRTLLQQPEAISRASDKLVALRVMKEAGVRVPEFAMLPANGVWLSRKRHGFGGMDIIPLQDGQSLHPRGITGEPEFYTKYIVNRREYRIHVFQGECIRVQGKYLDHPEQHTNQYVKNYAQGFRFRTPRNELKGDRYEQAKKAVEALGLDFGAVDVVIGEEDGLCYVLEVNTAPRCSPKTARAYCEAIAGWTGASGIRLEPRWAELDALKGNIGH